jgi:hypothetical protein
MIHTSVWRLDGRALYEHTVRHRITVAAAAMLAVVSDAAAAPAPDASLNPCVVRVEVAVGRVTLAGGGISGSDVTALRKVAKTCTARLLANDDVTFDEVTRVLKLVVEQGVAVQLGQPVGQWMAIDLGRVTKLWTTEPASKLLAAVKADAPRLSADVAPIVDQVASAIARARQDEPIGKQTSDRGLFEAIAQIVGLRRATAPVAIDLLERVAMPAIAIDATAAVSAPSRSDLTGVEMFEMFVAQTGKRTVVKGLLGSIPDSDQSTPYADGKSIDVRDGDWVVVATAPLAAHLASYEQRTLVAQYGRFLARSKLRDDDRVLLDATTRALSDLAGCVSAAVMNRHALVFRVLPPPTVELSHTVDDRKLPTIVITKTSISVQGASGPVLASLPQTSPRTIVIEAERSLAFGRIRAVAAAIGTPGHVTFILRHR